MDIVFRRNPRWTGHLLGAISTTLQALGFGTRPTSFGFVDLQSALGSGQILTVKVSGLPTGTVLYGMALHQVTTCKRGVCSTTTLISNLTSNSEVRIIGKPPVVTPEPGTLGLLGTRLIGLAGIVRGRSARYLRIISQDPGGLSPGSLFDVEFGQPKQLRTSWISSAELWRLSSALPKVR